MKSLPGLNLIASWLDPELLLKSDKRQEGRMEEVGGMIKLSRASKNFPEHSETFQSVKKGLRASETFQII